MLDRPTNPLDIALTVLRPNTLRDLRSLEARGEISFMVTLDQQATREANVLNSDSAWEASRQGMSDWEILQNAGIDTRLKITI